MKIGPVGDQLFHENWQVDMTKLIIGLLQMVSRCAW